MATFVCTDCGKTLDTKVRMAGYDLCKGCFDKNGYSRTSDGRIYNKSGGELFRNGEPRKHGSPIARATVASPAPAAPARISSDTAPVLPVTAKEKKGSAPMKKSIFASLGLTFRKDSTVRLSPFGLAFPSVDGKYVAYDKVAGTYTDVTGAVFDLGDNFCFAVSTPSSNIKSGDFILLPGDAVNWARVAEIGNGKLVVEKIITMEKVEILPAKSLFGFNFYTKLTSLAEDLFSGITSADGGDGDYMQKMLPFLLMGGDGGDDMMAMMLMTGGLNGLSGGAAGAFGGINPMLLMALSGGDSGGVKDMLPLMLMTQQMSPAAAAPAAVKPVARKGAAVAALAAV